MEDGLLVVQQEVVSRQRPQRRPVGIGVMREGRVISQDPAAVETVEPGTAVDLVVSKGQEPVSGPDVVGMMKNAAQTALEEAGLTLGTLTEVYSDTIPAGEVIGQAPEAGAVAARGAGMPIMPMLAGHSGGSTPNACNVQAAGMPVARAKARLTRTK